MTWTDDPVRDYDRYEYAQYKEAQKCPVCDVCGEPITEDFYYDLDGMKVCDCCVMEYVSDQRVNIY